MNTQQRKYLGAITVQFMQNNNNISAFLIACCYKVV